MCIGSTTNCDLCLLGITLFRAYSIVPKMEKSVLVVPTRKGRGNVELQCDHPDGYVSRARWEQEAAKDEFAVVVSSEEQGLEASSQDKQEKTVSLENYIEGIPSMQDYDEEVGSNSHLPEGLKKLLGEYADIFYENSGLGRVANAEHHIPTTSDIPVRSKPFRLSWEEDADLREEIKQMLELGLIRPSTGRYTSPVFFVRKPNGSLRLIVDFRMVNTRTWPDNFLLPHIDSLIDSLTSNGALCIFSTLDAAQGYWRIPMAANSMEKTGFICSAGSFMWNVMPFGLVSAVSTFQRTMVSLLAEYIGVFVQVFVDDIIVFSRSVEEHYQHLALVFKVCQAANSRLRLEKCCFAREEVKYLGHTVSSAGVKPNKKMWRNFWP